MSKKEEIVFKIFTQPVTTNFDQNDHLRFEDQSDNYGLVVTGAADFLKIFQTGSDMVSFVNTSLLYLKQYKLVLF